MDQETSCRRLAEQGYNKPSDNPRLVEHVRSSENLSRFATEESTTTVVKNSLFSIHKIRRSKWRVLLAFRQRYFEGFFPTPGLARCETRPSTNRAKCRGIRPSPTISWSAG
jgi:hypothetical protein